MSKIENPKSRYLEGLRDNKIGEVVEHWNNMEPLPRGGAFANQEKF